MAPYATGVTTDPGMPPVVTDAPPEHDAEPQAMLVRVDTGERIAYLDWDGPQDGAPLLLVHGLARTSWSWAPVARRLRARARVLAVDLRGHGGSDAPRGSYALEDLAIDVLTVASANGWGEDVGGPPFVLAGHGLGGMVAATMAALRPGSVRGLALLDGGWENVVEATHLSPSELLAALAEPPEVLASLDAFLADRRDFHPASWDADQERAARSQVEARHAGHVGLVTRPHVLRRLVDAMFVYRPHETLGRVTCPLLLVIAGTGAADDEAARERELALGDIVRVRRDGALPTPRVERLPTGHDLMRYCPGEVSALLLELASGAPDRAAPDPAGSDRAPSGRVAAGPAASDRDASGPAGS